MFAIYDPTWTKRIPLYKTEAEAVRDLHRLLAGGEADWSNAQVVPWPRTIEESNTFCLECGDPFHAVADEVECPVCSTLGGGP